MRTLKKAQLKAAQRYENFLSVLKITPDSLFSYASLTNSLPSQAVNEDNTGENLKICNCFQIKILSVMLPD